MVDGIPALDNVPIQPQPGDGGLGRPIAQLERQLVVTLLHLSVVLLHFKKARGEGNSVGQSTAQETSIKTALRAVETDWRRWTEHCDDLSLAIHRGKVALLLKNTRNNELEQGFVHGGTEGPASAQDANNGAITIESDDSARSGMRVNDNSASLGSPQVITIDDIELPTTAAPKNDLSKDKEVIQVTDPNLDLNTLDLESLLKLVGATDGEAGQDKSGVKPVEMKDGQGAITDLESLDYETFLNGMSNDDLEALFGKK